MGAFLITSQFSGNKQMQLTAMDLSELVRSLRSSLGPGEKRKHPRVGLRARAQILLNNEEVDVWVRDISAGGTNLSSPRAVEEGTSFDLLLSSSDKISCVSRYCSSSASNLFSIGAAFTQDVSRRLGR